MLLFPKSILNGEGTYVNLSFFLILLALIIAGFCVLVLNIDIPSILNDIFTLIALMFCVCDKVFESIIIWLASLF